MRTANVPSISFGIFEFFPADFQKVFTGFSNALEAFFRVMVHYDLNACQVLGVIKEADLYLP